MAFQAPRIIGGGQIIQPQAQGNPFKGITDEINIHRDRELKKKALELEARNLYSELALSTDKHLVPFEEWYNTKNE